MSTRWPYNVQVQLAGVWTDITNKVYKRAPIVISRGRADEATVADPSTANLTVNNRGGPFSPRNPVSPYFGILGRNTPMRVGMGTPPVEAHAVTASPGTSHVAPSVTATASGLLLCVWAASQVGDYTLPGGLTVALERDGGVATVAMGYKTVSAGATGTQTATFSASPGAATTMSVFIPGGAFVNSFSGIETTGSDQVLTVTGATVGQYLMAVHTWSLDPNNRMQCAPRDNAAGYQAAGWVLIGDTGPSATAPRTRAYLRRVTTAGTQVVHLEGTFGEVSGATADSITRIFLISATDYFPRHIGEVSSWPTKWDLSGRDVYTQVQSSGILRRLGQGATPVRSAIKREILDTPGLVAYWPMEDPEGSTSFASAVGGTPTVSLGAGATFAADDGFACSGALPTFTLGGAQGFLGYPTTNKFTAGVLVSIPETGMTDQTVLLAVGCSFGTIRLWTVKYATVSSFRIQAYTGGSPGVPPTEVLNLQSGPYSPAVPGSRFLLSLSAQNNGANVDWVLQRIYIPPDLSTASTQSGNGSIATQTVGGVNSVAVGLALDLTGAPTFGHMAVTSGYRSFFTYGAFPALVAYTGELAGERFKRLCTEEGIPVALQEGRSGQPMGPQRQDTLIGLLREIEKTDDGVIFEPRGILGLAWRGRPTKHDQGAALALSYTAGNVSPPFEPTDDDQAVINDITVGRDGGSTARAVQTTGPLSVLPPPNGVGLYDDNVAISTDSDARLPDQAGWRLHLGTWDEARYPNLTVDMARNPALSTNAATQEIGDVTTVANLPAWLPPGPIELILEGYQETLTYPVGWDIVGNYSPAGPYRVLMTDSSTYGRADSLDSTLASAVTSSATSFSVAVAAGSPLWVTTATLPGEFPFTAALGGEEVTVTAITGTSSPQTWTVTRAANGITKAHSTGAQIRLAHPVVLAL